ncbi:MAG: LysM peptidoglycan-binding domain-containing protein [Clostridia bacterium]|nr:LysM peptidoglycan-binding domain-containing protein [Clostridia bacterium]
MTNLLFVNCNCENFVVRATCESIVDTALKFNCPPSVIIKLNHLTEQPSINQLLLIRRARGRLYRVKVGDSLRSLSLKSGKDIEHILAYNCISDIFPGIIIEL